MNELHKYATFSVDLLGTPNKINSMFSMARARVFAKGINRNRSIIDGEVADKLAATIPGTPIIGAYNYDTQDFEGHETNTVAYGFVPLDPHYSWVEVNGNSYLEVDVVIWDGRFEEAKSILAEEKSLSMELNPQTIRGSFEKINNTTYYRIEFAEFAGITVLGDDVEPCFPDAKFITAYSQMVSAYALYVESIQENCEGGKNIMDNIIDIVEPEVAIETAEETISTEEVIDAPVSENGAEVVEEVEVETTESEVIAEESENETEFACGDKKTKCAKCGEDKTKCACGDKKTKCEICDDEPCDDREDDSDDKEDDEFKCKKEDYDALVSELEDYKAKYESLQKEHNEALNSLKQYTKKEKLEIINKFSTKLESEELIETLTEKVDDLSVSDIKDELGRALVEQMSTEEVVESTNEEANFSLNINLNDNSLGNSAWDLVKRHKQSK